MKIWTIAAYAEFCKDTNEGLNEAAEEGGNDFAEITYEVAESCLANEPGLKEFIKAKFPKVTDLHGMLVDDICYPNNCRTCK